MCRHLSFEESHRLTQKAQEAIRTISPNTDVVVHAEPAADSESIREKIEAIAAREHFSAHNNHHPSNRAGYVD